jgi:hypothetical protein
MGRLAEIVHSLLKGVEEIRKNIKRKLILAGLGYVRT